MHALGLSTKDGRDGVYWSLSTTARNLRALELTAAQGYP